MERERGVASSTLRTAESASAHARTRPADLRAERRAGELLAEMELHGGDRRGESSSQRESLKNLGIDHNQSHRWQRMAGIPEPDFDAHVERTQATEKELTTAGVLVPSPGG